MRPVSSLASCSYARSPLAVALASPAASSLAALGQRSFHASPPSFEREFKKVRRLYRKKVAAINKQNKEDWFNTQPDPFLGMQLVYANGVPIHEQRWRQTKLASTILDPHSLWTSGANTPKSVFTALSMNMDEEEDAAKPRIGSTKIIARPDLYSAKNAAEHKLLEEEAALKADEQRLRDIIAWNAERMSAQEDEAAGSMVREAMTRFDGEGGDAVKEGADEGEGGWKKFEFEDPIVQAELARVKRIVRATRKYPDSLEGFLQRLKQEDQVSFMDRLSSMTSASPSSASSSPSSSSPASPSSSASAAPEASSSPSSSTPSTDAAAPKPRREPNTWSSAVPNLELAAHSSNPAAPIVDTDLLPVMALEEPIVDYARSHRRLSLFSPENPVDTYPIPAFINYKLAPSDLDYLFNTLPHATAQKDIAPLPGVKLSEEDMAHRMESAHEAMRGERESMEAMGRILTLRNASARAIRAVNTQRIVEAFGKPEIKSLKTTVEKPRAGPDSGSIEVQAALLTMRIRNLRAHCMLNMHDTMNTTFLRKLAYKRKRLLEYLKRKDRVRYDKCLMELGIDKRAVEGALVIHKFWRQVAPPGKTNKDVKYIGKTGKTRPASTFKNWKHINPVTSGDLNQAHY